jgi:hypothetical protein
LSRLVRADVCAFAAAPCKRWKVREGWNKDVAAGGTPRIKSRGERDDGEGNRSHPNAPCTGHRG